MNYKECNTLLDLLNKGNLEKLKEYIEKEKNRYYLTNARDALKKYLRPSDYCFYKNYDGGLILTNGISGYILNSDEILTDTYKNRMSSQNLDYLDEKIDLLINKFRNYENQKSCEVSKIGSSEYNKVDVYGGFKSYSCLFSKENYDYASMFLGENTTYHLLEDSPVCLAYSPKGKGLIMGMRKK